MSTLSRDEYENIYNQIVNEAGADGLSKSEVDTLIDERVARDYAHRPLDRADSLRAERATMMKSIRKARTDDLIKNVEYLADYLTNPDEASLLAVTLWAESFTTYNGVEKAFAYWTIDDIRNMAERLEMDAMKRAHKAAEMYALARRIDTVQARVGGTTLKAIADNAVSVSA